MPELSNYQTNIISFVGKESSNLVVVARAGSGKTFTIRKAAAALPDNKSVLFVAFNKHIADELKKNLPPNVTASTTNSFGWQICRSQVKNLSYKTDAYKTDNIFKTFFNMDDKDERKVYYQNRSAVQRMISLFKANIKLQVPEDNDIITMADDYGIDVSKKEEDLARLRMTYAKCLKYTSFMDFDDQIFMPIYLGLTIPKYDVVIVDEAQDLNPIQRELICAAGRRVIAVGDDRQAIYGFRGADPDSIKNMVAKLDARILPLSICYRCPRKVVEAAAQIVPDIEAAPGAKEGIVETIKSDAFVKMAADGDYVLCRTTAPLVSNCLKFIREGRKAVVRGRDIGQQLLTLVDKLKDSPYEDITSFANKLNAYHMEQVSRLSALDRDDQVAALNDRVETIKVLMERCNVVGDIANQVKEIFDDEKTMPDGTVLKLKGIVFCSVHRSKGLEAERVFILCPELLPHPAAKKPWQKIQEDNLKYVAITRALGELYWVVK